MKNKLATILAALVGGILVLTGVITAPPTHATEGPRQVSYVVMPHPDDEWQSWALVDGSTSNYKVMILLTQGEQTQFCGPSKWQQDCRDRRVGSWLNFFTQMRATDPAIPGDWEFKGQTAPLPSRGYSLTVDNGSGLVPADTSAKVWTDRGGMGAAIAFDLGDGDLTSQEVRWAIETVRDNRTLLGVNDTLPNWNILGTFYNAIYPSCPLYPHPDHRAVHEALWNVNFGMKYQSAASCATDPDGVRLTVAPRRAVDAAWGGGGAFATNYGWLGNWTYSDPQRELFHGYQTFWTRHPNP